MRQLTNEIIKAACMVAMFIILMTIYVILSV
jgi:hypothetical protein